MARGRFYFIRNGKTDEEKSPAPRLLYFLYYTRVGAYVRLLFIQPWISRLVGLYKKSFLSRWEIKPFIRSHNIVMADYEVPCGGYHSFNDFFIRTLKLSARHIASTEKIIVSPADAKLSVIDLSTQKNFIIKNTSFSISSFLNDSYDAENFREGTLLVFRLAPSDYHRFHLPCEGIVGEPRFCGGMLDSVQPIVFRSGRQPLITNQRVIIPIKHHENELEYRIIAVGALCVGKVVCLYKPDTLYHKGDELGYFEFGGSTVCLLFKKGVLRVFPSFLENGAREYESAVIMGESIAQIL